MTYMLGQATVEDFDAWKSNFDDNEPFRAEHGELGFQVFQSVEDPNEVTIVFEWDAAENARALFESDEMRARLADAGVVGEPDLSFYEKVDERSETRTPA